MRNTTYFSQLKESLFDFLKQSTQGTDPKAQLITYRHQFYQNFHKRKKLLSCQISSINIIPGGTFWRSYAIYTIDVSTIDLHYIVKRRFSQFQQFYKDKHIDNFLQVKLPSKTYFRAGWAPDVTKQRTVQFNNLIERILSTNYEDLIFQFFDFIQIFQHYQEEGLLDSQEEGGEQIQSPASDEDLIYKISKLNQQPANCLTIIQQIKGALSQRKKRVPYDVAKHFLSGLGSEQGIMSIILGSSNEIVILKGLQMLVDIFSPQTNRDNQVFLKVLSRCNPSQMVLIHYDPTSEYNIIKVNYFQLLRFYKQSRGQQALQDVIRNYQNRQQLQRQFYNWQKLQRLQGRG